jgi:hypothetical protein
MAIWKAGGSMKSKRDKVSNMMLFCALMMVKNASATLQESVNLVPLSGSSKNLADKLGMPASFFRKTLTTGN